MIMRKLIFSAAVVLLTACSLSAQYWQQGVKYKMEIDFNAEKHRFSGEQSLEYSNNSADTLYKVFYHLYYNAFQPGSVMDVRNQLLPDPDPRLMVKGQKDASGKPICKISVLKPDEIGYQKVEKLTHNGKSVKFWVQGTVLVVELKEPILPKTTHRFDMKFESQVPLQIRRTGRNSDEGVAYSMTQWYPKICEYDYQGWHADPYVGREFYGVWGDFDVKIKMDSRFTIGGSGYLQNANEIGHGYQSAGKEVKHAAKSKLTWHFLAPNVHDFAWAADDNYVHDVAQSPSGVTFHFIYKNEEGIKANWKKIQEKTVKGFEYLNKMVGQYPYKQFTVIQGGDGGMEYPMATLITGKRDLNSLLGVTMHELIHNWFYGLLGSNETLYPWMDEGFTSYATSEVMGYLNDKNDLVPQKVDFSNYFFLVKSGDEEPLTTHGDHYQTNTSYGIASYSKGSLFLVQMKYILGEKAFAEGLHRYFYDWRHKHPTPNDCVRSFEKTSGLELDWYLQYWMNSTQTIDYKIDSVYSKDNNSTTIRLHRKGNMPMPIDLMVEKADGHKTFHTISLDLMYGHKTMLSNTRERTYVAVEQVWPWTNPFYELTLPFKTSELKLIQIDPENRMADVDRDNNSKLIK